MRYAQTTVVQVVEGLSEAEWNTPGVCGVWSTKQIIGHLIGWEHYLEEFLAPFAGLPMSTPHIEDYKILDETAFNDKYAAIAAGRAAPDVMEAFQSAYNRCLSLAERIPPETWHETGTLPWSDREDLEDFIVYGYYGHKYEHAAQIRVFRDNLSHHPKA
jgi:hypothetical protein